MSNNEIVYSWPDWFCKHIQEDKVIGETIEIGKQKGASEKHAALAVLRMVLDRERQWLIYLLEYKTKYGDLESFKHEKPINITEIDFGNVNGS